MSETPDEPTRSEEELTRLVMPTIVELQRVLVDRLRGTGKTGTAETESFVLSITSCGHQSCH